MLTNMAQGQAWYDAHTPLLQASYSFPVHQYDATEQKYTPDPALQTWEHWISIYKAGWMALMPQGKLHASVTS